MPVLNCVRGAGSLAVLLGLCLTLTGGCSSSVTYEGPERAAVSGKITLDGNPLPYGNIVFLGGKISSALVENGSYSIPEEQGPTLGEATVQISGYNEKPVSAEDGEATANSKQNPDNASAGKNIVPKQYNAATTLKVTITSGANTHDFALTTK
jgi:hypothetical protein